MRLPLLKTLSLLVFLVFNTACIKGNNSGGSKALGGTSSGSKQIFGKWSSSSLPVTISISSDFSSDQISAMKSNGERWDIANSGVELTTFSSSSISNQDLGHRNDYLNDSSIQVHQVNNSILDSGALAITVYGGYKINAGTSDEYIQIAKADILFNYYDFSFSNNLTAGTYDIASVMVHEMGHLLGLDHISTSESDSIMNPYLNTQSQRISLRSVDINNIKKNYPVSSSALRAGQSALTVDREAPTGEFVTGYFELRADKTCRHFIEGKLISEHKLD